MPVIQFGPKTIQQQITYDDFFKKNVKIGR